jgi:hypothetical protein
LKEGILQLPHCYSNCLNRHGNFDPDRVPKLKQ